LIQKRRFFAKFVGENNFKNHNIGPWSPCSGADLGQRRVEVQLMSADFPQCLVWKAEGPVGRPVVRKEHGDVIPSTTVRNSVTGGPVLGRIMIFGRF
jgi:hypothetical protein